MSRSASWRDEPVSCWRTQLSCRPEGQTHHAGCCAGWSRFVARPHAFVRCAPPPHAAYARGVGACIMLGTAAASFLLAVVQAVGCPAVGVSLAASRCCARAVASRQEAHSVSSSRRRTCTHQVPSTIQQLRAGWLVYLLEACSSWPARPHSGTAAAA